MIMQVLKFCNVVKDLKIVATIIIFKPMSKDDGKRNFDDSVQCSECFCYQKAYIRCFGNL